MQQVNRETYPELFQEMDAAASAFWAYPSEEWQDAYIEAWLEAK